MRSKCEVIFKESDFKSATIRSAKTQYEISTLSLIRISRIMLILETLNIKRVYYHMVIYELKWLIFDSKNRFLIHFLLL